MKKCSKCKLNKTIDDFHKSSRSRDGLHSYCKACSSKSKKAWFKKNRDRALAEMRDYYKNNKEKINQKTREHYFKNLDLYKTYNKKYYQANKEKRREYLKTYENSRYENDLQFKLKRILRCRLNVAIKNKYKSGSAVRDLGCSIDDLIQYLSSKFKPEMTWNNHGDVWEIDHVVPLSSFDLTDPEQLKRACHYTNLQPLLKQEHFRKTAEDMKRF